MEIEHTEIKPEQMVQYIGFINREDGDSKTLPGPFKVIQEGGQWEVSIEIPNKVNPETAGKIKEIFENRIAVAATEEKIVKSGNIKSIDIIENTLLIAIDSPKVISSHENIRT